MNSTEDTLFETDRLKLRRLTSEDAGLLFELDSDPEVMRFISKGAPTPLAKIVEEYLPRMLGYMNTWSATKAYTKAHGVNPVEMMAPEFAAAWGDPAAVRTVRWAFHIRVGRVP